MHYLRVITIRSSRANHRRDTHQTWSYQRRYSTKAEAWSFSNEKPNGFGTRKQNHGRASVKGRRLIFTVSSPLKGQALRMERVESTSIQRFLPKMLDQHMERKLPKVASLCPTNEHLEVGFFTLTFGSSSDKDSSSKNRGAPPKSRSIQISLDHRHLVVSGIYQCPICCHAAEIQTATHSPVVR